jgi:hypothetical protein
MQMYGVCRRSAFVVLWLVCSQAKVAQQLHSMCLLASGLRVAIWGVWHWGIVSSSQSRLLCSGCVFPYPLQMTYWRSCLLLLPVYTFCVGTPALGLECLL